MAAPLPMLAPYLDRLWQQEHYQFFPLVFGAVALLVLSRWDRRFQAPRSWLNWCLVFGGWGATALSVAIFSPWMAMVGFVALASSWLHSAHDGSGRSLLVLSLPLVTLIRLPLQSDMLLIGRLQGWTTTLASLLLDVLMVPHMATGNVIELASRELFVAEACSGIQSVFTLFFLASLSVAYGRRPLWFVPLYWAAAVLLAVLGNAIRVAMVAAAEAMFGIDWTAGWSHEVLGYVTLLIAVLLLLSFDQGLTAVLHPMRDVPNYLGLQHNPLVDWWNRCLGEKSWQSDFDPTSAPNAAAAGRTRYGWVLPLGLLPVGLLLSSLTSLSVAHGWTGFERRQTEEELTVLFTPPANMLAGVWSEGCVLEHEIARNGQDRRLGRAADIWSIADQELRYQVVLSQPYLGWHELCICYENLDWELADRSILRSDAPATPNLDAPNLDAANLHAKDSVEWGSSEFAFARFRGDDERRGYLLFAGISYDGRGVAPPLGPGFIESLGQRFAVNAYAPQKEMLMLQLWMESDERLHGDDLQRLRQTFDRVRIRILETLRKSPEAVDAAGLHP